MAKRTDPVDMFNAMMDETDAVLPDGFARKVDEDISGGDLAASRRLALEYLERPFHETTEKLRNDRELAVATAHVAEVLEGHIISYGTLLEWLRMARIRMIVAGAVREDMDEVRAEAKADAEREKSRKLSESGSHLLRVK